MKIKLLHLNISGVKSLRDEIQIRFSNNALDKKQNDITKVKTIYGINGSGKTAIILGVDILLGFLRNPDYLASHKSFLDDILNFETHRYCASCVFALSNEDTDEIVSLYSYRAIIKQDNLSYVAEEESLDLLTSKKINGTRKNIFHVENGKLVHLFSNVQNYEDGVANRHNNLLLKASLLSLHPSLEMGLDDEKIIARKEDYPFSYGILALFKFSRNVATFTDYDNIPLNPYVDFAALRDYAQAHLDDASKTQNVNQRKIRVLEANYDSFVKSTLRLEKFIKLFKPSLRQIELEVEKDPDGLLWVRRKFNYGGGVIVDEYLESSGIKRIDNLFSILDFAIHGGIVFVDELDMSVSSVYLIKLLEYFQSYSKGQLCFTSHNTYLMKAVQDYKRSIDFILPSGQIKTWTKNGHYQPEEQFANGMIPGLAINTIPLDYYEVFPVEFGDDL